MQLKATMRLFTNFFRKRKRIIVAAIALLSLFHGSAEGLQGTHKCAEGQYYDAKLDQCIGCDSKCRQCNSDGQNRINQCTQCKDQSMVLDQETGLCQCPYGTFYSMATQACESESVTFNQTRQSRLKFTSQQRRNLQTVIQTQGQVIKAGQNTTFTGIEFKVTDSTYDSNYMFTVDSYVKETYVTFKDSIIDVRGNFFQSAYPIRLVFDNCIFKVASTATLLNLDYSQNGCRDIDTGILSIQNSSFIDTTLSISGGASQKTLFNIKSLNDITFSKVTFNGLKQKQMGLISDHTCTTQPLKAQKVIFDQVSVTDSNFQVQLSFSNFSAGSLVKPNQLQVHLTNSKFRNLNMPSPFFTLTSKRDQSIQVFNLQKIEADQLTIDSVPLINLQMALSTGWSILASQINVINSKLTDFLQIEGGESFTASGPIKFDMIDNMIPQAQNVPDAIKSGLISLTGVGQASFLEMVIQSSSLSKSPALIIDSVNSLTMTNCMFSSLQIQYSDLVVVRKIVKMSTSNVTVINVLNSQIDQTKYAFSVTTLNLVKDMSKIKMEKPTLKNSQIPLLSVKGVNLQNPFDTSKYLISLQYCQFSNNLFNGYDLLTFTDLPTSRLDLENLFCIPDSAKPQCADGLYYDTIMKTCTKCPKGCASCKSDQECTACSVQKMIVSQMNGQCECPSQQYYYDVDGLPRCRDCLSKCQTCQNEYQCLTYKTCPNSAQYLNLTSQQCGFQCTSGFLNNDKTCKTCSDSNCAICDITFNGQERCGLCQNGYFLDLSTYQCKPSCPSNSKAISSNNTQSKGKNYQVRYCRPFASKNLFEYFYYVNPNSTSHLELGTFEYPFKNMDSPAKEIFNFMYEKETNFTVYHARGTSMKHYYGVMPIIIVNVKMYTMVPYGDEKLPKPRVYVTGHEYLWPDSTLFSLAESFYDFTTRVQRGDMDVSESTKFFLKINVFRSSMTIQKIDFQSIMFGDAWSNPLIFSFDAPNRTVLIEDCYLDLDGALYEAYFPISLKVRKSHFNLTNYQYGVWNDFRWDCYTNKATDVGGYLIIEESKFTGKHQQALYNFLFFSSFDDFILRNNTFDSCTYLDMETRPFLDVHPQSMCDPDFRTQNVFIDNNKFLNLDQSSLIFAVNYMNNFNGTKIFSMQNNYYENSIINSQLISMQIQNPSKVTVGNNYYKNVTVLKDKKVFYFFSEQSNITIRNETLVNNVLDDLYTIGAAKNVLVEDFIVINNTNTGAITETSAILRVSTARNSCQISRFSVSRSKFKYGKAIEIEQAKQLIFTNAVYHLNSLQNQDFFVFNQIVQSEIRNLKFTNFTKASDKSRFALSMPTLTLVPGVSDHVISNISFTDSQSSFISIQQVQNSNQGGNSQVPDIPYNFSISNCNIANNQLQSKDPLIEFGEINYMNFQVSFDQVNIMDNVLELGTIYQLKLNCKQLAIRDSLIQRNIGQFALLEPASSDEQNPLNFYMKNTNFIQNYARADALIQLTSNSVMRAYNSKFIENYSTGRGSVVFADYQAVYALFENCDFMRNYAYQGGVFYVQYSSQVEVSNCVITENYAITGGVAYVNNDGQIKINKGSRVFKNSALNSCFLFLINTQFESMIDNITITQNDQLNALIVKDKFLEITGPYLHFKADFFESMKAIQDKVQRTINERADTAIYAIKAKVNLTNTEIYKNDVILSASTESVVSLTNTTIHDIYATGKIITAVASAIEMYNVTIHNVRLYIAQDYLDSLTILKIDQPRSKVTDTSIKQSTSALLSQSKTPITSQSLEMQFAPTPPLMSMNFFKISIVNKSFLRASNCTFEMIQGTFLYVSGSNLIIDSNSTIQDLMSEESESELFMIDTSTVVIQDTKFQRLNQSYVTPILRFQESTLNFQRGSFKQFNKTLFFLEGGNYVFDTLNISQGKMAWVKGVEPYMVNSIVFEVSSADLSISNSDFDGIFTNFSSPIIYIENDPAASEKHKLTLYKSRFTNNVANETAGVILSINTNVTIDQCYFANNQALYKDAGALYLDCQDSSTSPCLYDIKNTNFVNNSAKINGGAIKYTYYSPNTTVNNTFSLNQAQYGANLASYPVQMHFANVTPSRMLNQNEVKRLNLTNAIVYELENALVSGSLMTQNITLEILDEKNRTMITDNSSVAIMSSQSPIVTVMKSKSVRASFGRFTFDDVIVVGPPGTDILLKVNTDSVSKEKIGNAYPLLKGSLPDIYIKSRLRICLRGEFQTTDYKCIQCSDGFYTLKDNQTSCLECPENAVCNAGYNISLDAGYWRESNLSTIVFECYNKNACIGGNNSQCAPGYEGKLCHSCGKFGDSWYSREANNECEKCLPHSTNSWRLAGVSILILLYFALLIYVNIRAVSEGSVRLSTVYMRILTNYFQILTLASSYDLSWSDNMKKFLYYISIITKASEILFSVDCFLKDNGIEIQPQYFKMVMACAFPFVAIFLVAVFWGIVHYFKLSQQVMSKLTMSIIILIFMTLPTVTSITFAIYNCVNVFNDGNTYLALDVSLQCWSGDHNFYAQNLGIPIISLWIVGLPLITWYILFRKRTNLADDENIARYGFLYTGLNHQAFYWEIILHFRKVLMICINVFMTTFKPLYRALIGFMLMIVYIEVLQKVQPYSTQEVNYLEFKANIAAFATFYGGLFFISSDLHISVSIILFLLILAVNFVFWVTWLKMMFFQRYLKIRDWISKNIFGGKYFAGAVQGDISDIAQINAEKMLQHQQNQMMEGQFEGEFDLQGGDDMSKLKSRQQYQEEINEEEEGEEHDGFGEKSGSYNQNDDQKSYNAFASFQKKGNKHIYRTVDQSQHQNQRHQINYGPGDDSNMIEDSFNEGAEEQYDFIPQASKKTKDKARDKKDRQTMKARNIIENDEYSQQDNDYDAKNQRKAKSKQKEQNGQFKTMDIRQQAQNFKPAPKNAENSLQQHKKLPDESQDIVDDSISIQSSIDIDSQEESYDIYETEKQRKYKKQKKSGVQSNQASESHQRGDVIMRKNTTVDESNKRGKNAGKFQSISNDSNESTPAAIESGLLGKSQTTHGTSYQKNAGDIIDKNSLDKFSKDQKTSSVASQQPQGKESKYVESSEESTPKLDLRGESNNLEQMRQVEEANSKERGAKRDKSRKKSKKRDSPPQNSSSYTPQIDSSQTTPSSDTNPQANLINKKKGDIDDNPREKSRDHERHRSVEKDRNLSGETGHKSKEKSASRMQDQQIDQQAKASSQAYKKQMEKKGRNEEKPRQPQIDLSNQQDNQQINMNRTVLPQEKIFEKRNGGDPMKMTAEDKPKNGDYKKMQSRKIVEDRLSSSEEQQHQLEPPKKETSKHREKGALQEEEKRSKSRGHDIKRHQINDGVEESNRDDQGQRKVSKLRPKNQRNEGLQQITPSMFGKGQEGSRQEDRQQDQDIESAEIEKTQKQQRKRRFEDEDFTSNQQPQKLKSKSRHKKSKKDKYDSQNEGEADANQGKSRDRGGQKKRREIRDDSMSPS